MYSQGWWQMSKKTAVSHAMNLNWFAQHGLQSFISENDGVKVNRNRRGTMSMPGGVGGQRREPLPTRLADKCFSQRSKVQRTGILLLNNESPPRRGFIIKRKN